MNPCLLLLLFPLQVRASGPDTHAWITSQAITLLPPGELRDLLSREDMAEVLANGVMFPDGGYAVNDAYGEIAHWEPFQGAFLDEIRASYPYPFDKEGDLLAVFLMGMAAHGMEDQTFDGMYLERAYDFDAASDWSISVDMATDVVFAAQTGGEAIPLLQVPTDPLVRVYADAADYIVDANTLEDGQSMVIFSLQWVVSTADQDDMVAEFEADFPWACSHLLDETVPGSPPLNAAVVALYWQDIWDRLVAPGAPADRPPPAAPILATFPADGSEGHPLSAARTESWLSLVFARGLAESTFTGDAFQVADSQGDAVPVVADLYYGDASHVVNLAPAQDWIEGETYTVTVSEGLAAIDGTSLPSPWSFSFVAGVPIAAEEKAGGCGCAVAPGTALPGWLILLGLMIGRRRRPAG